MSGLTEMFERLGWIVPEGFSPLNASVCKRCTHEVLWCSQNGRRTPRNRDGSRHPWECSVGINQVRAGEGVRREELRRCPYCDNREVHYPISDLGLHIQARHPLARTLPRT